MTKALNKILDFVFGTFHGPLGRNAAMRLILEKANG